MNAISSWFSAALSSSWAQLALDVVVKATVLLVLAALAAFTLRRSSAAVRHRVWCLTFAGLLLLPGLSAGLPEWRLAVLPTVVGTLRVPQLPTVESAPAESGPSAAPRLNSAQMDSTARESLLYNPTAHLTPGGPLAEREDYGGVTSANPPELVIASGPVHEPRENPAPLALATLWLLGAIVAVSPLMAGLFRNYLLRRRAQPVAEAAWTGLLDELRARLSLRRRVALYETRAALMPMTWGMFSPIVLLPHHARTWTERLRRFVLLHELAHVKRCDVGFQLLARLACSLYWFHPLAWYALRHLRIERELACDDCVVLAGERPSDYAAELLAITRSYRPLRLTAAVPMAQTSNLERRIRALFDRACSHLPVSPRAARLLLLGTAIIVTTIAVIRLAPRPTAEADEPQAAASGDQSNVAQPPSAGEETPLRYFRGAKGDKAQPSAAGASAISENTVVIRGRVLDMEGMAIAGARVRVVRIDTEHQSWAEVEAPVLVEVRTDAEGAFSAVYAAASPFATREQFVRSTTAVLADAGGYAFDWRETKPGEDQLTLQLSRDDAPIVGRVLDLEGRPVEGVRASIHAVQGGGENLDTWIEEAKHNPPSVDEESIRKPIGKRGGGPKIARFPGGKSLEPGRPELLPQAVTDQRGRFQLSGLGRDRLVTLQLAGGGIAKSWLHVVTRDMPAVPYPEYDPRFRVQTCFGRRFDLTAEPEQPISGVIRDADTGEPLPGVEVRLYQYAESLLMVEGFISAVTDQQGRYTLRGTAKPSHRERTTRLRVVPAAGQPYFRTEVHVGKQEGLGSVTCTVALKRATLIRGQVTDAVTGRPIVGLVSYFPFLSNKAAADYANFVAGMTTVGMFEGYATRDDGTFVVPGLPGRGVVAFVAKDDGRYPQSDGAAAIADLKQTTGRGLNLYHLHTAELATALREVDPPTGAEEITCEIKIKPVATVPIRLIDEAGQPLTGVVTRGLRPPHTLGLVFDNEWSPDPLPTDTADLAPGEPPLERAVLFLHRGRKLAATLWLSDANPPGSLVLRPCATIAGRLIDGSGKPVSDAWVYSHVAQQFEGEHTGRPRDRVEMQHRFASVRTSRDGKFQIELLPSGTAYVILARLGDDKLEMATPAVQPGESLYLGDVALEPANVAAQKKVKLAEPLVKNGGTGENKDLGDLVVGADHPVSAKDSRKDAEVPSSKAKMVHGRVTRGDRPASGAHVAVIARRTSVQRGGELGWGDEVLAEATANENGEYSMTLADVSQQTHADATLVARQEGAAIAWRRVNLDAAETEAALDLPDEEPVRGKVIDVEGRPAAGVRISVVSVAVRTDNVHEAQGVGYHGGDKLPAWLAAVTSDAQGRFVLHGLAANHGVTLEVAGDDRFAAQNILLNTGAQEERGDRDRTYRPLVKNVKPGEEAGLVLAPAQPFEGTVRYADTGQGVPHARITIWASQEQFGSMMSVAGRADERGHYRISPRPGIRFGVTAYPPDGAAYLARETPLDKAIEWKAIERSKQVDLTLPRGVLVRGTVVEAGSETPVVGAAVQYVPESSNNPNATDDILTGWQAIQLTDRDGRFSMAVLSGPGRLLVNSQQAGYILQEIGGRQLGQGKPGGTRNYAHGIAKLDPQAGQEALDVKLELKRGESVTGRIVDEAGKPVDEALVISRLTISPYSLSWRGHTTPTLGGGFELAGLAKGVEYSVYFLDAKRRLGANEIIKAGDGERTIVLRPCGGATLRLVDGKGEPVPAQYVNDEMVVTPGASRFDFDAVERGELMADADFISNIDRINHPFASSDDESGKLSLRALIPGATYRLSAQRGGKPQMVKEFQVRADETLDLGEIIVERE